MLRDTNNVHGHLLCYILALEARALGPPQLFQGFTEAVSKGNTARGFFSQQAISVATFSGPPFPTSRGAGLFALPC